MWPAVAVGSLGIGGPWVGFVRGEYGFRVAFGQTNGGLISSAADGPERVVELLAAAIAYYEEALEPAPPQVEATQADLARLMTWLAAVEQDPIRRARLTEAIDAIDDGLAGDAVVARLNAARGAITGRETHEQTEAVDLLEALFSALLRSGAANATLSG
jgi:hypothetical protein